MKQINRKLAILTAISGLSLSFITVGCEREVAHTEETKVKSDGTVKTKEKTVTESPDGTLHQTESKTTTTTNKP
jgi:hypothetical protein